RPDHGEGTRTRRRGRPVERRDRSAQARLNQVERDLEHIRITQQTATTLADGLDPDATSRPEPPGLPEHPHYPQILAVFDEKKQPLRARDLCEVLDLGFLPKNVEGVRSKLKRLAARGILTETEPGLFAQNHP
ncbi:hypothetical protein, partial [Streptomyces mirabilis]|uniref:hypothetical protein n=1 Tax=Streptomyces mirabilis TaxID=68239 RepID=UPI0033BD1C63